ncbi:hypothetical protein [Mediterraneibacter agrestimuris]|uniref:hypothetical protein n=1 Tax=Mediterraneibacter agrestimuris TaxID=2941333 RepID=UPI00203D1C1D|nr:hypothetical protein [Mediterraneibacter agrestimuris]
MNFQYNYNLHSGDRKPLIAAMSQILGLQAVYRGAPSFAYTVGDYNVDRNGVLTYNSNIHPDFAAVLVNDLQERGFVAEKVAVDNMAEESATDEAMENVAENAATEIADAPDKLTIEIPDTGFTPEVRENLKKIVASKETLLKQALGADSLPIVELDGKIAFPWFTLCGLEGEADAYSRLITALCNMAKNQKRVTATERPVENAKYGMRLFLIRLGFIGDEYKTARKILLRNLTGNSSWKSGHKPERSGRNTASNESVEPIAALTDGTLEESPENKNESGEAYGK